MPGWLGWAEVPLFISDRRLRRYQRLPQAAAPWVLDSGGFTELSTYGSWACGPTPREYVERINRYEEEIGRLLWAAPQDWMVEDFILAKTGLSVREHQWRTIDNWYALDEYQPEVPVIKVVQGKTVDDYLQHVDFYRAAGLDLTREPLVGVGSVCRRQGTDEVRAVFQALHEVGVSRLHGFGLKKLGLAKSAHLLASADSMAWSFDARRKPPLEGCSGHRNCANCPRYALAWRAEVVAMINASKVAVRQLEQAVQPARKVAAA
jgi:hypothetical protein